MTEKRTPWGILYDGWMRIVGRFAFVQTLVILTIFYGVLIGPWGGWKGGG